jgi:hypothetical protein
MPKGSDANMKRVKEMLVRCPWKSVRVATQVPRGYHNSMANCEEKFAYEALQAAVTGTKKFVSLSLWISWKCWKMTKLSYLSWCIVTKRPAGSINSTLHFVPWRTRPLVSSWGEIPRRKVYRPFFFIKTTITGVIPLSVLDN